MNNTVAGALAVIIAYLLGSIPFGLIVSKLVARIDIRRAGSGNIGATNVARTLGAKWGVLVLVLDMLKGIVATALVPLLLFARSNADFGNVQAMCGLTAIVGHMFPCWLKFQGGKGVATALGVIGVLALYATLATAGVFVILFVLTRIVSLASILATLTFAVCAFTFPGNAAFTAEKWGLATFSLIAPLLIVMRHHANIGRLLRGEEPKFRSKKNQDDERETDASGEPASK